MMPNNRIVLILTSFVFFIFFLILNNTGNNNNTDNHNDAKAESKHSKLDDEDAPAEKLPPPKPKNNVRSTAETDVDDDGNHDNDLKNKKGEEINASSEEGKKESPSLHNSPSQQRQFFLSPATNKTLVNLLASSPSDDASGIRQNLCSISRYSGPNCKTWFKKLSSKYFRIHHLHEHAFSIERKVVRLFGPSLAQLFCSRILEQITEKKQSKRKNFKALIIDVGVNDAEDIPYWFEKFGYFDESSFFGAAANVEVCQKLFSEHCFVSSNEEEKSSCTKNSIHIDFRLFEPQQMYKKQIQQVLKKELDRKPSLVFAADEDKSRFPQLVHRHPLTDFVSIHGAFDAVAVGSDELHGTSALFYGQGEQASLGSTGKHAQKSVPVEVPVGSLAKMLDTKKFRKFNQSVLEGDGAGNSDDSRGLLRDGDDHGTHQENSKQSPILFMKVDCEGADPTIIVDSESLFASHRVHLLVFELHKNERGFPKKFVHSTEMLTKHGYEVYLLGRCHHGLGKTQIGNNPEVKSGKGSLMLLKMDAKAASQWSPVLEAGIAISPQLQKILKEKSSSSSVQTISEYLGGGAGGKFYPAAGKCGAGWEFVADF